MASRVGVAAKAAGKNPFTVICYICGREYGSKSISIHESDCLAKWETQNKAMPKHMRKPPPVRPTINGSSGNPIDDHDVPVAANGGASTDSLQAYNDAAYDAFQNQALFPCETCGRKFIPTALEHHKNACKPGGLFDSKSKDASKGKSIEPSVSSKSQTAPKPKAQGPQELVPCSICQRTFLPSALEHHANVCKDGGYFQKHPPPVKDASISPVSPSASKNSAAPVTSKSCGKCKSKVESSATFCSSCGTKQ